MYPELISIGPFTVHSFGLMMALAFVAAGIVVHHEFKRKGLNPEHVYWLTLAAAVGGLVGSKIHYLLIHRDELGSDPLASAFSGAGLVWYGGLIGGIIAVWAGSRLYRIPTGLVADACAPALAIGYAFGRIGCFLNGDDYGKLSDLSWAMGFPHGAPPTLPGTTVQPTQLYESFSGFLIFTVLIFLRKHLMAKWSVFCAFLIMAGTERFLVEYVRFNRDGQMQQQILAIITASVAGVALFIIEKRERSR